ncbi:MAG: hypothetical protein VX741_12560 [Pseudomonadota bacterium]|nr:hypothetical protein [Pseudomonadota bacterium]
MEAVAAIPELSVGNDAGDHFFPEEPNEFHRVVHSRWASKSVDPHIGKRLKSRDRFIGGAGDDDAVDNAIGQQRVMFSLILAVLL